MIGAGDGPVTAAKVAVVPPAPPPKYVDPCQEEVDAAKGFECTHAARETRNNLVACRQREAQSITARQAPKPIQAPKAELTEEPAPAAQQNFGIPPKRGCRLE